MRWPSDHCCSADVPCTRSFGGRRGEFTTKSLLAAAIADCGVRRVTQKEAVRQFSHYKDLHDRLFEILKQAREIETTSAKLECLFDGNRTLTRVKRMANDLGLGKLEGCMSRIDYEYPEDPSAAAKRLENSIREFGNSFVEEGESVLGRINPSVYPNDAFRRPFNGGLVPWESPSDNYHECTIHRADVIRASGKWNFLAELTNARGEEDLGTIWISRAALT